jgi:hypothetical protein
VTIPAEQTLVLQLHGFVAFAGRILQALKVGDPDLASAVLDDSSSLKRVRHYCHARSIDTQHLCQELLRE